MENQTNNSVQPERLAKAPDAWRGAARERSANPQR